jgi:signal transduction histidine kinase
MRASARARAARRCVAGQQARSRSLRAPFDENLLYIVAAAEGIRAGLAEVFTILRRKYAVDGVEWWTPAADGVSFRIELSVGDTTGPRTAIPIGGAGILVIVGESAAGLELEIARLRPLLHHWWTADQLAEHAARLTRRDKALEDYAALVSHDVKSSLTSALRSDQLRESLERALDIVDSTLDAVSAMGSRASRRLPSACDRRSSTSATLAPT